MPKSQQALWENLWYCFRFQYSSYVTNFGSSLCLRPASNEWPDELVEATELHVKRSGQFRFSSDCLNAIADPRSPDRSRGKLESELSIGFVFNCTCVQHPFLRVSRLECRAQSGRNRNRVQVPRVLCRCDTIGRMEEADLVGSTSRLPLRTVLPFFPRRRSRQTGSTCWPPLRPISRIRWGATEARWR